MDGEKEELKRQVEELTAKLEERERQAGGIDDQVALMEKSYELAAKYMGQNGRDGVAVQVPPPDRTATVWDSPPWRCRRHGNGRYRGCNSP